MTPTTHQQEADSICAETAAIREAKEKARSLLHLVKFFRRGRDRYRLEGDHDAAARDQARAEFYVLHARICADRLYDRLRGLR